MSPSISTRCGFTPPNIPARLYWAVTLYNAIDGTMPETPQLLPSRNQYDKVKAGADGAIELWFSPKKPKDVERSLCFTSFTISALNSSVNRLLVFFFLAIVNSLRKLGWLVCWRVYVKIRNEPESDQVIGAKTRAVRGRAVLSVCEGGTPKSCLCATLNRPGFRNLHFVAISVTVDEFGSATARS
jgi:hypothetical protein